MEQVGLDELLAATGGAAPSAAPPDAVFERVSTDSRTTQPGDLFWALRGETHNGHDYLEQALRRGAAGCVVDDRCQTAAGPCTIRVADTRQALGDFARWYRHRHEALIIGVTGSVGKTTTREMIYAALSARHAGRRSRFNYNNEVGLPLSLLDLAAEDEFSVLEMGAARVGDIRSLCEIACPEIGVLVPIGPAHLATFGSLDQIYQAKGELLEALPSHGFAVVCGDDERMRQMAARALCPTVFVGETPGCHVRALDVALVPGKLRFSVDRKRYEVPAPGRHFLAAALCAVAVAREIGMDPGAIAAGLQNFVNEPGRCHPRACGTSTIIDDTYNANPASMRAACQCLADWPGNGRKVLVLGDMLELGEEAKACHRELGRLVAGLEIDLLLSFGERAEDVVQGAQQAGMPSWRLAACRDLEAVRVVLDCWLEPGGIVLVKGSRGMHMERVVAWLQGRGELEHPPRAAA